MPAPLSASPCFQPTRQSREKESSKSRKRRDLVSQEIWVPAPHWLTARPVAHRGLHDRARGIIENMPGAAMAAIDGHFGIECDIQLSADGEAMVHHDDELGRLTEGSGALLKMTAAELRAVKFKNTAERMMTLSDLCGLVAGRVPLVIEVKSRFDG